jgi:hypothetical protein
MEPNLVSVTVPWARRGLLGGRSEAGVKVNIVQSIQDEVTRKMSLTGKLTMHRSQTSEGSSSQVEEGGGCSKARWGSRCRCHRQKRSEYHQDLPSPRRHLRLVSFSLRLTMAMEQQRSIPPGPRQNRVLDIHPLRVGVDNIELSQRPEQEFQPHSVLISKTVVQKKYSIKMKSVPQCGERPC